MSSQPPIAASETETNWHRCERLAREIDKDKLIRALLIQIGKMRKKNERRNPLWGFIADAIGHGSGVSAAVCVVYGVDADSGNLVASVASETEVTP